MAIPSGSNPVNLSGGGDNGGAASGGCVRPLVMNDETAWRARRSRSRFVPRPHQVRCGGGGGEDDAIILNDDIIRNDDGGLSVGGETTTTVVGERSLLVLLNKITPTTFELHLNRFVSEQLPDLRVTDEDGGDDYDDNGDGGVDSSGIRRMSGAIDAIVTRAAMDSRYARMHANICARLADADIVDAVGGVDRLSFRDLLVAACLEELRLRPGRRRRRPAPRGDFAIVVDVDGAPPPVVAVRDGIEDIVENGLAAGEEGLENADDVHDGATTGRDPRISVGHLRFVGELYLCGVLSTEHLLTFIAEAGGLAGIMPSANGEPEERGPLDGLRLEGLCILLETVGFRLELPPLAASADVKRCWDALTGMVQSPEQDGLEQPRMAGLTVRLRFMAMDLLDLRTSGWRRARPLQLRKALVAVTLNQIHEEAAMEDGRGGGVGRQQRQQKGKIPQRKNKRVHFGSK